MAVLSLGSNMGPREHTILGAAERLRSETAVEIKALSSLYETEPVGLNFSRNFINAVCVVATVLDPGELLAMCKNLEIEFGRDAGSARGDRPLDVDIICYGDLIVDEPGIRIPHPELRKRLFVLVPMVEIAPDFRIPPDGARARGIRLRLNTRHMIRKISSRSLIF